MSINRDKTVVKINLEIKVMFDLLVEQKSGEEISSTIDDSLQNMTQNKILTYPSFLSLSSANSKGDHTHEDTAQQVLQLLLSSATTNIMIIFYKITIFPISSQS